jgi:hypothetical protein
MVCQPQHVPSLSLALTSLRFTFGQQLNEHFERNYNPADGSLRRKTP